MCTVRTRVRTCIMERLARPERDYGPTMEDMTHFDRRCRRRRRRPGVGAGMRIQDVRHAYPCAIVDTWHLANYARDCRTDEPNTSETYELLERLDFNDNLTWFYNDYSM